MKALVIRQPWIGKILAGEKTWELRTRPTRIRGEIALIEQGSGSVVGLVQLVDCLAPLGQQDLLGTQALHGVPPERTAEVLEQGWTVPWVLDQVRRLSRPGPYRHPAGAVTWVTLEPDVVRAVTEATSPMGTSPEPCLAQDAPTDVVERVLVELTDGNIRNGHIYLREAMHLFPPSACGGPNRMSAGQPVKVWLGRELVETDIAGDKRILRARGPIRRFLQTSGARAGDAACIERLTGGDFQITIVWSSATSPGAGGCGRA